MFQKKTSFIMFFFLNIIQYAHTDFCLKTKGETAPAKSAIRGKIFHPEGIMKMDRDVANGFADDW